MVKYSVEENTALISLNRPEKRNALNGELVTLLLSGFNKAEKDSSVKSIILTGEGKSFCAGADLEYLSKIREHDLLLNEKDSEKLAALLLKIYNCSKPVIAAVNGAAVAGGCGLASVCDFVIASPDTKFGYTEVKIGFIPAIVSIFLIKRTGEGAARSMLLSADIISGQRAYEIGLVNFLTADVHKTAKELAGRLNGNSSQGMGMTKGMLRYISGMDVKSAVDYCVRLNALSRTTEDFQKGINSFLGETK